MYDTPTITVTAVPLGKPAGTYNANLTVTRQGLAKPDATIPITMTIAAGPEHNYCESVIAVTEFSYAVSRVFSQRQSGYDAGLLRASQLNPALFSASGPASPLTHPSTIIVTALNPLSTGTTNIRIRPVAPSTGFAEIIIPVTLNGQTTTRFLSAFPTQVTLSTQLPTQSVSISPSPAEVVPVRVDLSQNLLNLSTQGLFQIFGSTGQIGPGSTAMSFTLPNPAVTPAQTGTVTVTPTNPGQGYAAIQIPVYINSGGGNTGNSLLTAAPTSLTAEATAGGATVTRNISVTSADFLHRAIVHRCCQYDDRFELAVGEPVICVHAHQRDSHDQSGAAYGGDLYRLHLARAEHHSGYVLPDYDPGHRHGRKQFYGRVQPDGGVTDRAIQWSGGDVSGSGDALVRER